MCYSFVCSMYIPIYTCRYIWLWSQQNINKRRKVNLRPKGTEQKLVSHRRSKIIESKEKLHVIFKHERDLRKQVHIKESK